MSQSLFAGTQPISQLLTTSAARARSCLREHKKRQLVSHKSGACEQQLSWQRLFLSLIITKKKRHIKCFIATTDDEREICCWSVVVAVAAERCLAVAASCFWLGSSSHYGYGSCLILDPSPSHPTLRARVRDIRTSCN